MIAAFPVRIYLFYFTVLMVDLSPQIDCICSKPAFLIMLAMFSDIEIEFGSKLP